ncbi:MAG: rhomboid family intramembrane serine protease [Bacteroides sp.]|nr:rhomboid family intramembrane serine protease [Bacteroides sp.]
MLTDIKQKFRQGNIYIRLIYINVGVFLITFAANVLLQLFNKDISFLTHYFVLPAWPERFIQQPWSLFTYMFMHADILHILFNMLWLYWFGSLFLQLFSARHLRGLYILGGLCGGLLYLLSYNLFPYFQPMVYRSVMVGASASILAIVVATAYRQPNYPIRLLLIGSIPLKYLAGVVVITDMLMATSSNAGGHIAHLGGALAGWWFAAGLDKGHDPTRWINRMIDAITGWFNRKPSQRKPKMKVHYGKHQQDYDYNAQKKKQSEEVDRILEKLKKSGYDSLTSEEKKSLFDASKR